MVQQILKSPTSQVKGPRKLDYACKIQLGKDFMKIVDAVDAVEACFFQTAVVESIQNLNSESA